MWVYPKLDEIFGLCLLHFIILGDVRIQKLNCKGFPRAICRTWHVQFHHFQCLDFFCLQRIIFSSQLEWSLWAWLQEWCLIGICFTRLCMGCCIGMLLDLRDSTISNQKVIWCYADATFNSKRVTEHRLHPIKWLFWAISSFIDIFLGRTKLGFVTFFFWHL